MEPPEMINAGVVVLKRWEPAWARHAAAAVRASLAELTPFMPWAHDGYGLADAREFAQRSAEQWAAGTGFDYAMFTAVGDLIGSCGLSSRTDPGTLEIGYWVRSGHTGRGYATLSSAALARVGLRMPGVTRVVIRHDAANPASGAVAAKAGFTEAGRAEREPRAPGESGVEVRWERRR